MLSIRFAAVCARTALLLMLAATCRASAPPASAGMVRVPGGEYHPFYKGRRGAAPIRVAPFLLDREPVRAADYARFVARLSRWRRSRLEPLFAESGYLKDWSDDLHPKAGPAAPVTNVSWFAARAYCACQGKRLPSQLEWEWAAEPPPGPRARGAARTQRTSDASATVRFAMGSGRRAGLVFGEAWEWTEDFNTLLIANAEPDDSPTSLFCGDGFRATDARDYAGFLRFSFRSSLKANYTLPNLGFRCAGDVR